jgi:hypothetical protein
LGFPIGFRFQYSTKVLFAQFDFRRGDRLVLACRDYDATIILRFEANRKTAQKSASNQRIGYQDGISRRDPTKPL